MAAGGQTPAGWYPHPTQPGYQCYWDGTRWTEHVEPLAPQPQPAVQQPAVQPQPEPAVQQPAAQPQPQPAVQQPAAQPQAYAQPQQHQAAYPAGTRVSAATGAPAGVRSVGAIVALAAAGAFVLATFLPWWSGGGESVNAWEGDLPWIVLGLDADSFDTSGSTDMFLIVPLVLAAAALAGMALSGRGNPNLAIALIAVGGAALLFTLVEYLSINSDFSGFGVSTGIGVWLALLAGAAMTGGAVKNFIDAK